MCNLFSGHVVTEKGKDWGGHLDLSGTAITSLPDNLRVGGSLDKDF
jgi:hypothetical protein